MWIALLIISRDIVLSSFLAVSIGFLITVILAISNYMASRFRYDYVTSEVRELDDLLALTPDEFEELVANLLLRIGYENVRRLGGPRDRGVDIIAEKNDERVLVQCKRYDEDRPVTVRQMREFLGTLRDWRCRRGIFITTSYFTEDAYRIAKRNGIWAINGNRLLKLVEEYF